jgi:hypothetical protein
MRLWRFDQHVQKRLNFSIQWPENTEFLSAVYMQDLRKAGLVSQNMSAVKVCMFLMQSVISFVKRNTLKTYFKYIPSPQ